MRIGFVVLICVTILLSCAVKDSFAWGKTWMGTNLERLVREAGWGFGPFKVDTVFHLNNAGYDSNIYYGHADNPIDDYTFTAGTGFNIYLPLKKKVIFQVYESPRYVYYSETKRERTWNNYFNGQVHFALNRFFITVGKGFTQARQRWSTEIDIKLRRKEDSLQGAILWQASKKTSFYLRYRQAKYEYENLSFGIFNIRERLNREESYLNFTTFYRVSFRTMFFLDAEYGLYNFREQASSKDSRSYGIYAGFEFSPTGRIKGRINLGYKNFDALDPGEKDYRGVVGNTRVSVRLLRTLVVRASFERDVEFSLWYNNNYFIENRYGTGGSFYLFKKIRLDYDFYSGRNNYPRGQLIGPDVREKRMDDYQIHSVGIYIRVKKNIGLGLIASRWVRDSNLDYEDDERDFVGLNLTYDF